MRPQILVMLRLDAGYQMRERLATKRAREWHGTHYLSIMIR